MASTDGLVPITRAFLASYYDKYPFDPLSDDVSRLSNKLQDVAKDLVEESPASEGESVLLEEAEREPPNKVDENIWKNREQLEEIIFLLDTCHWPASLKIQLEDEDPEYATILDGLIEKFKSILETLISFQGKNSEFVFSTVMTYMPQDFRGSLIRQQRERSERNKQAEVDALLSSGGTIRDKYALLWKQQMERRRQLADLGSATGVYKTLMKYLVGVPEVLMDFVRQINDDHGPMEEQRERYGPPLYILTKMAYRIRTFLTLLWGRLENRKLKKDELSVLEEAAESYISEFERFIKFISVVFSNSPFFITAEEAGALTARKYEEYKEISIPAGESHELSVTVDTTNSYVAWDFSLVQGKMTLDVGFSIECTDLSGKTTKILPYRRYEADQGNFCACIPGSYKLVWDNSYAAFFRKVVRYKVDCIPPVVEGEAAPAD